MLKNKLENKYFLSLSLFATKKGGGNIKNGGSSRPKYLGVKLSDGQIAKMGSIIVRQRGTKKLPGKNVMLGRDHTIFSVINGVVRYKKIKGRTFVSVI